MIALGNVFDGPLKPGKGISVGKAVPISDEVRQISFPRFAPNIDEADAYYLMQGWLDRHRDAEQRAAKRKTALAARRKEAEERRAKALQTVENFIEMRFENERPPSTWWEEHADFIASLFPAEQDGDMEKKPLDFVLRLAENRRLQKWREVTVRKLVDNARRADAACKALPNAPRGRPEEVEKLQALRELAGIFEGLTGKRATVTKRPANNARAGEWLGFARQAARVARWKSPGTVLVERAGADPIFPKPWGLRAIFDGLGI